MNLTRRLLSHKSLSGYKPYTNVVNKIERISLEPGTKFYAHSNCLLSREKLHMCIWKENSYFLYSAGFAVPIVAFSSLYST